MYPILLAYRMQRALTYRRRRRLNIFTMPFGPDDLIDNFNRKKCSVTGITYSTHQFSPAQVSSNIKVHLFINYYSLFIYSLEPPYTLTLYLVDLNIKKKMFELLSEVNNVISWVCSCVVFKVLETSSTRFLSSCGTYRSCI